jgi:hypothetical protein
MMITDENFLIVQYDGDGGDTLQQSGFASLGWWMKFKFIPKFGTNAIKYCYVGRGRWIRHPKPNTFWSDPRVTTRDQLLMTYPMLRLAGEWKLLLASVIALLVRFCFAQNTRSSDGTLRMPDFMHPFLGTVIRSLFPFSIPLYPFLILFDLCLISGIALDLIPWRWSSEQKKFVKRDPNDTDDDNAVGQLAIAMLWMPTPLSWLARKVHAKYRPWNYGCLGVETLEQAKEMAVGIQVYTPVYGALRWKHRRESGGNEEVAIVWSDTINKFWKT